MSPTSRSRVRPTTAAVALCVLGAASVVGALVVNAPDAKAAAAQDWSPFVLVTGLLLIGLLADDDGLFAWAGSILSRSTSNDVVLFLGASAVIGVVTAILNLDTSVAFLTPVLIYTARSRASGEAPLLYGCLMLSNAGSLFLPGSNLTNLIVVGHLHISGTRFLLTMWAPALVATLVTVGVVVATQRREFRRHVPRSEPAPRPVLGAGLAAMVVATVATLTLASPALVVAGVAVVATALRLALRRTTRARVLDTVGAPLLIALFGVAVALGTLGRTWTGPSRMLSHLGAWPTGAVAALSTVLVNNLPAASLLAARIPPHPFSLLVGLNLGPNIVASGSLAWVLWWRVATRSGSRPSLGRASRLGLLVTPLSMIGALGTLTLLGRS